MSIVLPDGSERSVEVGATAADLAAEIGNSLSQAALAAIVDGRETGLDACLQDGNEVTIITADSEPGRRILRDSTAHLLAHAVLRLWPDAKLATGTATEEGFYYDFELPDGGRFSDDDLARVEERMREFVAEGQPFEWEERSVEEALELFSEQPYKREIIEGGNAGDGSASEGSGAETVAVCRNGEGFVDLCRGPHVSATDRLGAFKLLRVAGAYWQGDESRAQLQRIYGTAWESKDALDEHLRRREEAERRDHRRLGAELDLFSLPAELGGGLALWHPRGARVRRLIEDFSREEHDAAGYEMVFTPHLAKSDLWETSGHLDHYGDDMYPPMEMDGAAYYPKPMNCPFHVLVYKSRPRSFRDLPLRLFELGTVYRYERSGVLHGLLRIRGFTQDDSHIFCTREQLGDELASLLAFMVRVLETFGFEDFEATLATRPEGESVGSEQDWDNATEALREAIEATDLPHRVEEGEGTFYGPKIDVHVGDALGRTWQLSTLQVDFQLPQRFELSYTGTDNADHAPIMVHRALFGSVERFFGILLEHYAGALPAWLAPVQARVLGVRNDHDGLARAIAQRLAGEGFRADWSPADEPLGARVRRAKLEKVPYVLVVGDDDMAAGTVGVNARGAQRPERGVTLDDFVARLRAEVDARLSQT